MLFHDPSCRAELTLKDNHAKGMHHICKADWVAICTKSDRGVVYVDAQINETGIDEEVPRRFLREYGPRLTWEAGAQAFQMDGYWFHKLPIRQDVNYTVFSLYCRKGEDISPDNLAWLNIYSDLKYAYVLLNNESIQERELSEKIVDSMEAAIVVLDLTGHVVSCNGRIRRIFNKEVSNLLGQDFFCCIDPDCRDSVAASFHRVVERGHRENLHDIVLFTGMERIANVTVSPLQDSKGHLAGAVVVGTDVTDLRYMERELQQTKQFGLLGQIAAGLAHDVKNPLMNINGCAKALLRNGNLEPEHQELLNIILHESGRINDVIEQMLSFGNLRTPKKPCAMNLNDVLSNCVRIINRQKNGKQIDVVLDLDKNIPTLIADSGSLQQAFLNILVNSVEAIHDTGVIEVHNRLCDEAIQVDIRDNGCGVSADGMAKLFTPYYSTKTRQGGSGLGLFLARRVFGQHGAEIQMISEQNVGSTVRVRFPLPGQSLTVPETEE